VQFPERCCIHALEDPTGSEIEEEQINSEIAMSAGSIRAYGGYAVAMYGFAGTLRWQRAMSNLAMPF
jgi:signal recognition particle receptor subunit beta